MFEGVLFLVMGLIMSSLVVTFVATQNAADYGTGGAAILGFLGILCLLMVVRGFVKTMMKMTSIF
jgi:hypothetical protein